jgi:hypothetical protein
MQFTRNNPLMYMQFTSNNRQLQRNELQWSVMDQNVIHSTTINLETKHNFIKFSEAVWAMEEIDTHAYIRSLHSIHSQYVLFM